MTDPSFKCRVWADVPPAPIVTPSPSATVPDESALGFPGVFTACAVTRAMCCGEPEPEVEQSSVEEREAFFVSILESLLSVSRSDLSAEQRADPTLSRWAECCERCHMGKLLWVILFCRLLSHPNFGRRF